MRRNKIHTHGHTVADNVLSAEHTTVEARMTLLCINGIAEQGEMARRSTCVFSAVKFDYFHACRIRAAIPNPSSLLRQRPSVKRNKNCRHAHCDTHSSLWTATSLANSIQRMMHTCTLKVIFFTSHNWHPNYAAISCSQYFRTDYHYILPSM